MRGFWKQAARAVVGLLLAFSAGAAGARGETLLSPDTALYARAIRLSGSAPHILASVTSLTGGTNVGIYASGNGQRFTQVGRIDDPDFNGGLCCGTLFELPQAVGALPKGTVLWAGSVGQRYRADLVLPQRDRLAEHERPVGAGVHGRVRWRPGHDLFRRDAGRLQPVPQPRPEL